MASCKDTAYASLLSTHGSHVGTRTFLADPAKAHHGPSSVGRRGRRKEAPLDKSFFLGLNEDLRSRQIQLLVVLVRSLRAVEACRRDFVLMLGNRTFLSTKHQQLLANEGVVFHSTPPLFLGVPTADKFEVWRLTQYRRVVMFDSDVMVLKPIEDLFRMPEDFVVAHHPYDQLQAQCGIDTRNRGVAAMFVVSPGLATYAQLLAYVRRRFARRQLTYSDQTGLVCFFGNRTRTLPCSFLYEPANPLQSPGMKRYTKECHLYGKQNVLRNCLVDTPDGCTSWAPRTECEKTRHNLVTHCQWPNVYSNVHVVHFKGKSKPWPSMQRRNMACRHLRLGMPVVHNATLSGDGASRVGTVELETADLLEWNHSAGGCFSVRWQKPVYWAATQCKAANTGRCGDSAPVQLPKCCNCATTLAARWHRHLARGA